MSQKLSFFDLDRTLVKVNISFAFGKYLFQKGEISFCKMFYCLMQYARHKYFGLSLYSLQEKIFKAYFCGLSVSKIKHNADCFLEKNFSSFIFMPVWKEMQSAMQDGHHVTILSSSPDFLVEPIAKRLGINWQATCYLKDSFGRFSVLKNVLDGTAKASFVEQMAESQFVDRKDISAYSDSYLDLPFLQSAGCPCGVNPDRKLLKECLKNNWKILTN